jgi:hypothetical protein
VLKAFKAQKATREQLVRPALLALLARVAVVV